MKMKDKVLKVVKEMIYYIQRNINENKSNLFFEICRLEESGLIFFKCLKGLVKLFQGWRVNKVNFQMKVNKKNLLLVKLFLKIVCSKF